MIKILECSSKGDRRFSALYARFSWGQTIEEIYQRGKRDGEGRSYCTAKGRSPAFFAFGSKLVPNTYHFQHKWYLSLWHWYFLERPDLLVIAREFTVFRDSFDGKHGFPYTVPLSCYPLEETWPCCQSQAICWIVQCNNILLWDDTPVLDRMHRRYKKKRKMTQ